MNVHHCANDVEKWVMNYSKFVDYPIDIIDERSKLLGTAGTLFWHGDTSDDGLVIYTDTYSKGFPRRLVDLTTFWKQNPDKPIAGLITFDIPEDSSAGSVEVDFMGNVTNFSEKNNRGNLAWAGFMFFRKDFIAEIKQDDRDLARDVFPRLYGKMRVLDHVDAYDIGRGLDEYESLGRKVH